MKTRQFTALWGNNASACPLKVFHILWEKFYIFGFSSLSNLKKTTITMAKRFVTASSLVFLLAAYQPAKSQRAKTSSDTAKAQLRFLDNIDNGHSDYVETVVFKKSDKPVDIPAEPRKEPGINAVEL